jgi:hypothetical protein
MAKAITEQDMSHAGLSEEEIAALEESDADGTGDDESAAAATDDDKSDGGSAKADSEKEVLPQTADDEKAGTASDLKADDKAGDAKDDADAGNDKAEADGAGGGDGGKEAAAADDAGAKDDLPAPLQVDSFRAQLAARGLPEDYEQQITDTDAAIEALDKKLEDGEIEYAGHAKENRVLSNKMADLTAIKREAEFVAGNNDLIADQHWQWEVERFAEENQQFQNPVIYGALRGALEELYAVDDNAGRSYRWFLQEASKSVAEAFQIEKPKVDDKVDDKKDATAEAVKADLEDKNQPAPPQTLADIPASSEEKEAKDEFSSLDSMEGMDLEAALAKLPKADVDKYLDSRNY